MPKRTDIKKILIIGSGPIIISQACEFDYSGTQACKALKEEGFQVVLLNSNPATIMTDPEFADKTYIEPITPEIIEKIIEREHPDALLPTIGGQTALNVSVAIYEQGILNKYKVEMIGADYNAIKKAEDREHFKKAILNAGLALPKSAFAYTQKEAIQMAKEIGFPLIIRPSFTLGGTGGAVAYNIQEFEEMAANGLKSSLISEIMIEESVIGWKEFELEVMRDKKDNVVIICSIENFDPMGVHTGDSITVAPAQTLTDKEYQKMRDASIKIIREIGVETGGSNIQFAVHPENGEMVVIEMNPRVSRSSALASKATGFPIAKIAAKLAIGYTLDEIRNDITRETPASFEPTIDYCVVKIPRFTFEKFPDADPTLTVSMKSVGETMAIGRTFKEALQKGLRSLEIGRYGLGADGKDKKLNTENLEKYLVTPTAERLFYIKEAILRGISIEKIYELSKIDKWFLHNIKEIIEIEQELVKNAKCKMQNAKLSNRKNNRAVNLAKEDIQIILNAKRYGFSDKQLAFIFKTSEDKIRSFRKKYKITPVFKLVDTCAAEFEAYTPYYYSTYETEEEARISSKPKIMILGGGPNRIGQGIEFDYCCVHAALALKELNFETIMVNSNPETVSTDYDTSDKLYFEPITFEDVLNIVNIEKPQGVIVQFGGQTPLNLAKSLKKANVPIIGTSTDSIDRAEDRDKFKQLIQKLNLKQPENSIATSVKQAIEAAKEIGYPILVRPSYVLGGRAMKIIYDEETLREFIQTALEASQKHPILIDKFLKDAIEVDVDAISDGSIVVIGGIMEHIEEAGVHSGDSACVLPPYSISKEIIEIIKQNTYALAKELKVKGLMNVQYAIKEKTVYVLEVNPRASRTIPFVSKVTGVPLAKLAAKVMAGKTLEELKFTKEVTVKHIAVKEAVLPFSRFPGVDTILGPEMLSTGEVMGIDKTFGLAFAKSQISAGQNLPLKGNVFISVNDKDKHSVIPPALKLQTLGFNILATKGTKATLEQNGIKVNLVYKIMEKRPHVLDMIKNKEIDLIINTPGDKIYKKDETLIRSQAIAYNIPLITTIPGAEAGVNAIEALINKHLEVKSIQEYYQD